MDHAKPTALRRRRNETLIIVAVLLVLAAGLLVAARDIIWPSQEDAVSVGVSPAAKPVAPATADNESAISGSPNQTLVADDGQTLWVSPTAGPPIDLAYLPPGCQVFVHLRPAELLNHSEGEKVIAALGPTGKQAIDQIELQVGSPLKEIDRLLIGLQADAAGNWQATYVVTPSNEPRRTFIVAAGGERRDAAGAEKTAPPLRREMEQLLAASDADRHITILFVPSYLFGEGKSIFSGVAEPLRDPLFSFLGEGLQAAALSLHWSDDFFVELSAVTRIDELPQTTAAQLLERIQQLPPQIENWVLNREFDPYGRRVVARLPGMTRALARYTRAGVEDDRAILRAYLPVPAGHNLLMAGELVLAQSTGTGVASGDRPTANESVDIRQRLQRPTTLRFSRDTLEAALQMLADDLGVEIVILGRDLQLEGITKNQSFGLDEQDRPAEKILVEILRRANPDKTASGPADPRQKMIYVLTTDAGSGREVIHVTTRAAALTRGEELPAVFVGQDDWE